MAKQNDPLRTASEKEIQDVAGDPWTTVSNAVGRLTRLSVTGNSRRTGRQF
jgi:hypothetical protein